VSTCTTTGSRPSRWCVSCRAPMGRSGAGVHIRKSPFNASFLDMKFFDDSGLDLSMGQEKNIENLFFREDFVRADIEETGAITFPVGGFDFYVDGFVKSVDARAIKERNYNIVLDYSYGSAAVIFPRSSDSSGGDGGAERHPRPGPHHPVTGGVRQGDGAPRDDLALPVRDFGAMLDTGGEKIFLVDEKGDILSDATALQVICLLACRQAGKGLVGVPVTASRNVEKIAARFGMDVVRTRTLARSLMETAAREGVAFAGDGAGGFVFPRFQPAFDGMFAIVKIMELLAAEGGGLSGLLREIRRPSCSIGRSPAPGRTRGPSCGC